jgi:hypothetical protein
MRFICISIAFQKWDYDMKTEVQQQLILSSLANGPLISADLRRILGDISPATLSRLIARLSQQVVVLGQSRATQYARPRDVRGAGDRFQLYRVDETGSVHCFGILYPILGGSYWWQPATKEGRGQLYRDLPWFIQDMRPDGFMGRAFAHRVGPDIGLSKRLPDWNSDHVLVALARRGEDVIGNLIVGEESLSRYLEGTRQAPIFSNPEDYPRLAEKAIAGDPAGSSAAGEQPKFMALIERDDSLSQVLVKFSPPASTAEGSRWGDLLVCEHLALEVIRESGFSAVRTSLLFLENRTFLEVERFDRIGLAGRLPVHSLGVIDDEFFGHRDNWAAMAGRMEQASMMPPEDVDALIWLDLFGAMAANTDRHFGNVSVLPLDAERSRFRLAPAYDMLPMFYRPRQGEEILMSQFSPPSITVPRADLVDSALRYAVMFWQRAAGDGRISEPFRRICESNSEVVRRFGQGPRVMG